VSIKIAHISDVHIRKLKYHKEYRVVFERLYEKLREEEPDIIVNTGDTFHTKLDMSPEAIRMMSELFVNLADIAPHHIILGNHDMNCKNGTRLDALTPIIENLNHPNLHLHKYADTTQVADKVDLHVLSIVDPENWPNEVSNDRVNIALYHGAVVGAKTDTGWVMTHGDIDIETIEKYDYALLGDIHKTHQKLDAAGRCAYPGSLIQQNFGETNDKGFLLWEIESKEDFTCRHIHIENPKPFITLQLTPKGRMPRGMSVPDGARLRLISNNNLPLDTMKRAMEIAKHRFKPESISFLNRAAGQRGNVEEITNSLLTENLRDIKVQEELIDEYLADFQVDDQTMETVYQLNRKYNETVNKEEEISRNVNWKLLNFKWDNLFNYGEGNYVDFNGLGGIIGIFGKNFSGKSSIIDGVLYTLFNTTSKNERKNLNIINQNKDYGSGQLEIEVDNNIYKITRTSTKYIKRLHGEETLEAKTDLNFEVCDITSGETTSLNGLTRAHTDANIRKHFGSMEDFLVSSLASQHGSLTFLEEGSTRRKEIIAKFLDLEQFDKKFKLAKEDSVDARGALKKLEDRNYDEEYEEAAAELILHKQELRANEEYSERLQSEVDSLTTSVAALQISIDGVPAEIIDFAKIKREHKQKRTQIVSLRSENVEQRALLKDRMQNLIEVVGLIENYDINELIHQRSAIADDRQKLSEFQTELEGIQRDIKSAINKTRLLEGIPCGDQFPVCKFIRDANAASARLPLLHTEERLKEDNCVQLQQSIDDMYPEDVEKLIEDYELLLAGRKEIDKNVESTKLLIERNENVIDKLVLETKELDTKIKEYNDNIDAIENLEHLISDRNQKIAMMTSKQKLLSSTNTATFEYYRQVGSLEQKAEEIKNAKADYIQLRREYAACDLFMRCMHSNGIAYDIIKKKIPVINQEVAKMLANIVDFEVFFESNGNKFDIFIKHSLHDERPIEMGSGAEKTVAAMAIRLALLSVSSLPKGDIFILDEPGTALDEENMEGFIRILELIKVYFKNVLLISHLDSLKDCVDTQVVIEKKAGYARVNQ